MKTLANMAIGAYPGFTKLDNSAKANESTKKLPVHFLIYIKRLEFMERIDLYEYVYHCNKNTCAC